ncbi:F-box domain protein [Aphelenchoides besseyi]|nr:F-box domain protein [Aphelenchoides besseyi]
MATVNYAIFGERVPRLRKPPPLKPLPSPTVSKLQSNPFLRLPLAPRFRQPDVKRNSLFKSIEPVSQPKTDVKRRVKKVQKEELTPYKPKFIPNLPDKILWQIFNLLDYKNLCKCEAQKLLRQKYRKQVSELSVEMLGNQIRTLHQVSFKRYALARLMQPSGVEHLWIVVTRCSTAMLNSFIAIESDLFTELTSLTVQIHIEEDLVENVGILMQRLSKSHSNLCIDLELHANTANKIFKQLEQFKALKLNRLKLACSALDSAVMSILTLAEIFEKMNLKFKRLVFLYVTALNYHFDGKTPIVGHPVLQLHFNSCSVSRSTQMVATLQATMKQRRRKRKVAEIEQPKAIKPKTSTSAATKPTVRKVPFIRRMEITGSFSVTDLIFLSRSQHVELEKQIKMKIPTLLVDTSDVYYFE